MPALLELRERAPVGPREREAEWLALRLLESPEVRGVELTPPQRLDLRLHLRSQLHAHSTQREASTSLSRVKPIESGADQLVFVLVYYLHLGRQSHLRCVHVISQRVHLKPQVQRMNAHHSFALNTCNCTHISTRSSNYWSQWRKLLHFIRIRAHYCTVHTVIVLYTVYSVLMYENILSVMHHLSSCLETHYCTFSEAHTCAGCAVEASTGVEGTETVRRALL